MKALSLIFAVSVLLMSCSNDEEEKVVRAKEPKTLVQTVNGIYTEFYEDGKTVKITGELDSEERRHGKWTHYSKEGQEMGFTFYMHGLKHGHSLTKYPNGTPYYYGEYRNDTMVGEWKTYDKNGEVHTKDYGGLE